MRPADRAIPLALLAILAACSSPFDTTSVEDDEELRDALAVMNDVQSVTTLGAAVMGTMTLPVTSPGSCLYNPSSQRFECQQAIYNGITLDRYFVLLDGSGNPLGQWGPTVVAIRNVSDMEGTLSSIVPMHIESHDESTLSGLGTSMRTMTATGTTTTTMDAGAGPNTSTATRTANLTIPERQGSGAVYPTGTVQMSRSTSGQSDVMTMTMTYDGTPIVTIAMTYPGGQTTTCTFNLSLRSGQLDCD